MSIAEILHTLILGPLELLFDTIFSLSLRILNRPVFSIVFLSLAINFLVLPLYLKADAMQLEEKETAARLKPRIDRIKKAFTGDERFMILQTYYRQNNYKPYYVLKGSVSLLLQIPFFMAAYNFLSHLQILQGVSLGPIPDLGRPDGILTIGGITLNLLPILMTAINIVSGMIYTRGMPLKSKIQLYGMALVFLVLLYDSPAGLVFYWTLNNIFSLLKNVVYSLKAKRAEARADKKPKARKRAKAPESPAAAKTRKVLFYACCVFLTVWNGLLIPSGVIKASPGEFVNLQQYRNPLHYLLPSFLLAAGTFLLWTVIFYRLASEKAKRRYSLALSVLSFTSVLNFMAFGTDYGNMNSLLRYDKLLPAEFRPQLINLGCVLALGMVIFFLWKKKPALLQGLAFSACLAATVMTVVDAAGIQAQTGAIAETAAKVKTDERPSIPLSKSGKNVVVIMLDRAVDGFVPFLMNEKPELQDQFTGFTWYPNTLSYGIHTNIGSPCVFGGYDYIPDRMQARADTSLKDKQNESLMVMPLNFMNAGWEVTVFDAPYANYQWNADMSIYDPYPAIHKGTLFNTMLTQSEQELTTAETEYIRNRNFFCYSIFRSAPTILHSTLYQSGLYNETDAGFATGSHLASLIGMSTDFINSYRALEHLTDITEIREEEQNTFVMMANNMTHDVAELQEPDYVPISYVDNSAYDAAHPTRTAADGREIDLVSTGLYTRKHYQSDMAAFLLLGKWFDFMKENGVYDNTRIILVGDHGFHTGCFDYADMMSTSADPSQYNDPNVNEWPYSDAYNPLLLVKDYGTEWKGYTTDNTFMTNADTPTIAFSGNVENPVNPAFGTPVTDRQKYADEQHLLESHWVIEDNNGNTFANPVHMIFTGHDIFDFSAWRIVEDRQ